MSTTTTAPAAAALRWLSLVGAIWLQSVNGTNFNFPAYSSQLKQLLSISQLQLNNLAFASDAGKLFGWVSGVAAAHLPLWLVLLIGSFLGLVGYGVQLLYLTNQIPALTYWHVFWLSTLAGNSICWINTVCCTTAVTNFPRNRQLAVGLSTSYQGLSAKIYMDIADAVMPSSGSPNNSIERAKFYLFLNSFLPLLVCIITAPFVRKILWSSHHRCGVGRGRGFVVLFIITIATGVFAVTSCLASIAIRPTIIGLGVLLAVPLVVPLAADLKFRQMLMGRSEERTTNYETRVHSVVELRLEVEEGDKRDDTTSVHHQDGPVLKEADNRSDGGDDNDDDDDRGLVVEEVGVRMMLRRLNFWLYFFVYIFGATIGFVFLNNLGQIAESRGFPGTASLVSLSSSFGFFGRLVPSLLEYFFSRRKGYLSTPLSMAVLMAPMSAAFLGLLNGSNGALYLSTAVIGVCTGAITSVAVSLTTELFGAKNFSVNHNVLVANIPIGSFVFGSSAAVLYRREATEEGGGGRCMGTECFRYCFITWASLCFFGTILALILYARTRHFYYKNQKP